MNTIETVNDIQQALVAGFTDWKAFGEVYVRTSGDLVLFNYTQAAQYKAAWTPLERMSRGLIINSKTGEIVARPFDKFHNWLEGGRKASGHIVTVTEKMDGSLGILYRVNGGYRIATRGSFDGEQALWATEYLNTHYVLDGLPDEYTLLFEIIYPENRVVVDYGARRDLVLLAVRNRFTGDYLPFFPSVYELAQQYGFSLPAVYNFNDIESIIAETGVLDANHEGFVLEFSDGSRWKLKGDRYREIHKLISQISYRNVLRAMQNNALDTWIEAIPDEFLADVLAWSQEIESELKRRIIEIEAAFDDAPKDDRKTFALWVNKHQRKLAPYLFARLDNRPLEALLFKDMDSVDRITARTARALAGL